MIPAALFTFAQLLYWEQGSVSADELRQQGITRIAAPPGQVAAWQKAGLQVVPLSAEDRRARIPLDAPGVDTDAVASATQRPWIDASGWRFLRQPGARFFQAAPAGRGPLAVAEAHLYGADVVVAIEPGDLASVAKVLAQLRAVPAVPWPDLAQIEVVDDGSELVGEVMNLLSRRNLLWRPRRGPGAPPPGEPLVVELGTSTFPRELARSPSELAYQLRRRLGDDRRWLRVFGSEAVLGRVQGEGGRVRISLLHHGGGLREGVRLRLRGRSGEATAVTDHVLARAPLYQQTAGVATELTVPPFRTWAVVDLARR